MCSTWEYRASNVPSRCNNEIAAPSPNSRDSKKLSRLAGDTPRVTTPRNSPFGLVTLRAMTVVHPPVNRLFTGARRTVGDHLSATNPAKKLRSAMLRAGAGQDLEELISCPPA